MSSLSVPEDDANPAAAGRLALLPAMLILLLGGVAQSMTYLNHDVAWVLYSSERLLDGGVFGRDIVAANPPLIWWLSAAIAAIARALSADPILVLRAAVLLASAVAIMVLDARVTRGFAPLRRAAVLALAAILFTVTVQRDFAQREHLSVLFCLPWLLIVAERCRGGTVSLRSATAAGIAAGIGLAFKPHFLAVAVLVTLFAALRGRRPAVILSVENITIGLTFVAYLLAIWVFARPYLSEVVPQISQVYWGFAYSVLDIAAFNPMPVIAVLVALALAAGLGWQAEQSVLALASLGFLIAALAQAKGYSYHFYPVVTLAVLSMALAPLRKGRGAHIGLLAAAGLLAWTLPEAARRIQYRSDYGAMGQLTACLVTQLRTELAEGEGFLAFSTHPFPGFPVANYAHRDWLSASNSRLYMPAIVRLRARPTLSAEEERVLAMATEAERRAALTDLSRSPGLVLVDARPWRHAIGSAPFDFLAFYLEDPAFARLWAGYREIPGCHPGLRTFLRDTGAEQ